MFFAKIISRNHGILYKTPLYNNKEKAMEDAERYKEQWLFATDGLTAKVYDTSITEYIDPSMAIRQGMIHAALGIEMIRE